MTKHREAFTIFELIFVIVILGILASILIPKLAMNRNDAQASNISQELAMCINESGGYYLMDGTFDNALLSIACDHTLNTFACYTIAPDNNAGSINVKNNGASTLCTISHSTAEKNGLSSATGIDHQF